MFVREVPISASSAQRLLWNMKDDNFKTYVVCPKCDSVYEYEDCVVRSGGERVSGKCTHIAYPNHPYHRLRIQCGAYLLKKVRTGRRSRLVPIKEFPYQSLQKSLGYLAKREGFLNSCEQWRQRASCIPQGYLGDVYDGRVWHEFSSPVLGITSSWNLLTAIC